MAPARSRVRLDLNSPEFQDAFFRLETDDLKQVVASLRRLRELDWNSLYRHTGFRWEAIEHVKAHGGITVHSLRLGQRIRAVGVREGDFLRLVSLHPDHDSAYRR
ncbi:MAG: hypothetical protein EXQ59_06285 [Acidobacteria bacterium]|nr:hypothetical protein [Acidobacteriota bacterium]